MEVRVNAGVDSRRFGRFTHTITGDCLSFRAYSVFLPSVSIAENTTHLAENAAVVRPRTHYPFLLQYACTPAFSRASPSFTVDLGQATFMRRKVRPFPP